MSLMQMFRKVFYTVLVAAVIYASACAPAGGEKRGHEFMPDMVHSTAYEANLYDYYYYNTWGTEEEYMAFANPRLPVKGTIPRGSVGVAGEENAAQRAFAARTAEGGEAPNAISIPPNGAVPYYYDNSEEDRLRAMAEITGNPFPITEQGLKTGEHLYTIYCGICHGPKADGLGHLVREGNPAQGIPAGVYPAQPANLQLEEFVNASEGRYYHSIMYGRNMMGSYADKLSYEERWLVIHHIRSLQAKQLGLTYNADENTLNNTAVPGNTIDIPAEETAYTIREEKREEMTPGEQPMSDEEQQQDEGQH
jgi:mono/diheme cytochrome c family protein